MLRFQPQSLILPRLFEVNIVTVTFRLMNLSPGWMSMRQWTVTLDVKCTFTIIGQWQSWPGGSVVSSLTPLYVRFTCSHSVCMCLTHINWKLWTSYRCAFFFLLLWVDGWMVKNHTPETYTQYFSRSSRSSQQTTPCAKVFFFSERWACFVVRLVPAWSYCETKTGYLVGIPRLLFSHPRHLYQLETSLDIYHPAGCVCVCRLHEGYSDMIWWLFEPAAPRQFYS